MPPKKQVEIKLMPIGNVPKLKKAKIFKLRRTDPFLVVQQGVTKVFSKHLKKGQVFTFSLQASFTPSPDETLGNLTECFGQNNTSLEVGYSLTPNYG
ncbi:autophagy protein [Anaeramoeba flamelloides]|uniref:Ubiquitin-like protein ATG12 n=2 Tax=Anaeramoeba flamelloides TaxID=1746091 RepID=A0AAV8AD28_9EUKA|nr:autophagy protein [Anaeramoeba flamelloides]